MRNDFTAEQLQQPVTLTIPLVALLDLVKPPTNAGILPVHTSTLPAIGGALDQGDSFYAGLTIADNAPAQLILLPGEFNGNWKDAGAWAKDQGGVLPSRVDALILWQNLPGEFKKEAYWTDTQHAATSDCAWYQNFGHGNQLSLTIYGKLRARAVRRLAI